MSGAIALPRRRKRRRRRPRGFEWVTLFFFVKGVVVASIAAALGFVPATACYAVLVATTWVDRSWEARPDMRNGARAILYAWLVGEPE